MDLQQLQDMEVSNHMGVNSHTEALVMDNLATAHLHLLATT
jgi:hypothetical protein